MNSSNYFYFNKGMEGTKVANLITMANKMGHLYNIRSLHQILKVFNSNSSIFNINNLEQEVGLSNLALPIRQLIMVINNLSITILKTVKTEERATLFKNHFKSNKGAKVQIK